MEPANLNRQHRIAVILGSVRPGNNTAKAVAVMAEHLESRGNRVDLIDPGVTELPLPGIDRNHPNAVAIRETVQGADGVIVATPEYHGSFSSVTKLVIENLGFPSVLAGKPVSLVGVAAGAIGAVKSLEALRGVCSHVGAIVLPGPVSVARVRSVFDEEGNVLDERVEKQLRRAADGLTEYIDRHVCPFYTLESMVRESAA